MSFTRRVETRTKISCYITPPLLGYEESITRDKPGKLTGSVTSTPALPVAFRTLFGYGRR